jgi:hypothetical protein
VYISAAPDGSRRGEVPIKSRKKAKRSVAKKKVSIAVRTRRGPVQVRVPADATPEERAEAAQFVETLEANRQIARGKTLTPGTTHQVVPSAKGKKTLVRKRYSGV